jgi:GGDEF domain-containing protein
VALAGRTVKASISIGAAFYPDHGDSQNLVYRAADHALYAAKLGGRDGWRLYRPPQLTPEERDGIK